MYAVFVINEHHVGLSISDGVDVQILSAGEPYRRGNYASFLQAMAYLFRIADDHGCEDFEIIDNEADDLFE